VATLEAIIHEGGRQYSVRAGEIIEIDRQGLDVGTELVFDDVRLVTGDGTTVVGRPRIEGARVTGTVAGTARGPKLISFKYRRRKHSSATRKGHRQRHTLVKITGVEAK
jgi:large subunit ribosomal protein L21